MSNMEDTPSATELKQRARHLAIQRINERFGADVTKLHEASDLVTSLTEKCQRLEDAVSLTSHGDDRLSASIAAAESCLAEAEAVREEAKQLQDDVNEVTGRAEDLLSPVADELRVIQMSDKVKCYLEHLHAVHAIGRRMEALCKERGDTHTSCQRLVQSYTELQAVATRLNGTRCVNLQTYVHDTHAYWRETLLKRLSDEVEQSLTALKYPFSTRNPPSLPPSSLDRFTTALLHLTTLHLSTPPPPPPHHQDPLLLDYEPLALPLDLLFQPFRTRFTYNFSGAKKTNSPEHPEWCLYQTLQWAGAHRAFWGRLGPVLARAGLRCDAQRVLSRALVSLVVGKLGRELREPPPADDLFCRAVNELLAFDAQMTALAGPTGVLRVLTQPEVFSRWLRLERACGSAVLDEALGDERAWFRRDGSGHTDCGEALLTLLHSITDRFAGLPSPTHRLQLHGVQLGLCDDFRVRVAQLSRPLTATPLSHSYTAALVTLRRVAVALEAWQERPVFLELAEHMARDERLAQMMARVDAASADQPDADGDATDADVPSGAFAACVSLYRHLCGEMTQVLRRHVASEARARLLPYRRDAAWFSQRPRDAAVCRDVSASLCPLLDVLGRQLHALQTALCPATFAQLWPDLATDLDRMIFEEVVQDNHFTSVGAEQFSHDLRSALHSLFAAPCLPLSYAAAHLLLLPLPTALLLRDTLAPPPSSSLPSSLPSSHPASQAALEEAGLRQLTPAEALDVLRRRLDLVRL